MRPIPPTRAQVEVFRRIAAAGFAYDAVKDQCSTAGWELIWDEPHLGFVQYFLWLG